MMIASALALGRDPSPGWLTYATWNAPAGKITMLNTSWVVPSRPQKLMGSNAPGWWYGVQTADGDGALIQPILAWGYQGFEYTMFNGVFDWSTGGSWSTSPQKIRVLPGDTMVSSTYYVAGSGAGDHGSYTMVIASKQTGATITTNYKLRAAQGAKPESRAYFVLEHAPETCASLPASGVCTFSDIYLEVDHVQVRAPQWQAVAGRSAKCGSKTTIVDARTIGITWSASGDGATAASLNSTLVASKWTAQ